MAAPRLSVEDGGVPELVPQPTPLEYRAEVRSLEALQHRRRQLIPRYAALAAKFKGGSAASADTKRKQHRALVARMILTKWPIEKKEPSEVALERLANAHSKHRRFCDEIEQEFAEYIMLDNEITEINEKIRSRETELMAYNAELRMQR